MLEVSWPMGDQRQVLELQGRVAMKRRPAGFGLIEALLALALGVMVLAAASQLFGSAYQAWRLQGATARLQDDARLVLQRLAEDIRMAGMFGCLRLNAADFRLPAPPRRSPRRSPSRLAA
jgi:Tfp pilus assembly protein PilW